MERDRTDRETEWKADPGIAQVVIRRQNAWHRIRDTSSLSPAAINVTMARDGQMLGCQDGVPRGGDTVPGGTGPSQGVVSNLLPWEVPGS